jgi:hypothetical protein
MELFPKWTGSEGRGIMDAFSSPHQLADWLEHLNEEDCARMRATSSLWKTWRRLMEHRTLTGHSLSLLSLPPNAINPN